jgi:hypothetical protein
MAARQKRHAEANADGKASEVKAHPIGYHKNIVTMVFVPRRTQ